MRGLGAAVVAIVVLWVVDANFNGGHYTIIFVRMLRAILALIGINI